MVRHIHGSYKVKFHPDGPEGPEQEIDFTPPFRKMDMLDELSKRLNVKLPAPDQFNSEQTRAMLDQLCVQHEVDCPAPRTTARLLDKVRSIY